MYKQYKAIESERLSKPYDKRYVIIDVTTGEIVNDAQGWGFKSPEKAYGNMIYRKKHRKWKEESDIKDLDAGS